MGALLWTITLTFRPDNATPLARIGLSSAEKTLLNAIVCPTTCRGLLPALLLVESAVSKYLEISKLPRVKNWLKVIQTLLERVEQFDEEGMVGLRTPMRSAPAAIYQRLCTHHARKLSLNGHGNALALLGILVLDACSRRRTLPEPFMAGWYTLVQASGKTKDWTRFYADVPTTLPELTKALEGSATPGLIDLISGLLAALSRPLRDPEQDPTTSAVSQPSKGDFQTTNECTASNEHEDDNEDDPHVPSKKKDADSRGPLNTDKARDNPVGWLVQAANFATHIQRFDLIGDRDRLHPEVTKAHWNSLKRSFEEGGKRARDFVTLAHISLRFALPARIALHLSLEGSRSAQIHVPAGMAIWNCRAALDTQADPALDALEFRSKAWAIKRHFDGDIADHLRFCSTERPDASTLSELLGINTDPESLKGWLREYRKFLRDHASKVHAAYDARFASSLSDVYRYCGAGEAMALLGGLDFDAIPVGMVHYITLDQKTVAPVEEDVFRFLGWRMPNDGFEHGLEGSPISITRDRFRQGWSACQRRIHQAREALKNATTGPELVSAFNRLARGRLLSVITLAGHRGTRLSRLKWRAMYQHSDIILIYDKDVGEYQSSRCIPTHEWLVRSLTAWQQDLALLQEKVRQLEFCLASDGRRALPKSAPDDPVFFELRHRHSTSGSIIERASMRVNSLEDEAQACFASPLNIGRHFLISQLIAMRVSTWTVRVLTGHCRVHAEAFSDGMHVPPAHALKALKQKLEELVDSLDLDPVVGWNAPASSHFLIEPAGNLPAADDPYLWPSSANLFRILPPPFDDYATLALKITEGMREHLRHLTDLSPAAEFTASQALYGLLDLVDQEQIFHSLSSCVYSVGDVAFAVWSRPNCAQEIGMRLNDRSVIALSKIRDRHKPGAWQASAEEVGRWARKSYPNVEWPTDDLVAFHRLTSLALRFRRFHFSPNSLTAASSALPSATFSRRSILRAAGRDPAPQHIDASLGKALRQGNTKAINKTSGPLYEVASALRRVSRIDYPLGGEIQRANDWKAALEQIDLRDDLRAQALKRLHEAEIALWDELSKDADETSTLAGHQAEVLTALSLLSPCDDLAELTDQDWREWVDSAKDAIDEKGKNTKAVKEDQPRYFGLKRMVRMARKLGWAAPQGMFSHEGPRMTFDSLRRSAASTALLRTDFPKIRQLLHDYFSDWPILQWQSRLASLLLEHHPLRSSEQVALVANCLIRESQMLLIAPGSFSHLKTVHAYRLLHCAKAVIEQLNKMEDGSILRKSQYLFLNDEGWDWSDARSIDEAHVSAAAQVTGEASIRKHSFRGSAYCRLLWQCWEDVVRSLFCPQSTPRALHDMLSLEWERGFTSAALAARSAGHGMALVGLVYYSAAWPLMHCAQSRALLLNTEPDSKLVQSALGSTGPFRNAKSAAKSEGKEFDAWSDLARRCVKRMKLPPLVPTEDRVILTPRTHTSDTVLPPVMSCVRLVASLLLGGNRDERANCYGIPVAYAKRLESMLPGKSRKEEITRRRRGIATPAQLSEDLEFIESKLGSELLTALASKPLAALQSLLVDLAPYRRNPRDSPPSSELLSQRMASHLKVLPHPLRLQIRFSRRYGRLLQAEHLHSLGSRLVVGADDARAGGQPQCQVLPAARTPTSDTSDSPDTPAQHEQSELVGRLTVATRVFIEAIEIVLEAQKGISE